MTREILSMQPGPELDSELAKVLGGCTQQYRLGSRAIRLLTVSDFHGASTTWEGMRLIVEAMAAKGWWLNLHSTKDGSEADFYQPSVLHPDGWLERECVHKRAEGKDAPHAVAIAARLALDADAKP